MNRARYLVPVAMTLGSLALLDCGPNGPGDVSDPTCSSASFDVGTSTVRTFGTSADARKIETFLRATLDLNTAVIQTHDAILDVCRAIARDLQIPTSELASVGGADPIVGACGRVSREIETILRQSLPASARLELLVTPPVCQVNLSVSAQCAARCTGRAEVDIQAQCMGTVVADCSGSCTGSCSGSCGASCTGSCSGTCTAGCMGTCTGSCTGTCNGTCNGTCSAMDAMGRCTGTCTGTCQGSCSGSCQGSCSANCMGQCTGTCSAGCSGSCMGQCRGMCSVASNLRCDGHADVNVDVQCDAACEAQANARATCTEPQITINFALGAPANAMRLQALVTSLRANLPRFQVAQARITRLVGDSVPNFANSLSGLGTAARNVGLSAAACVVQAGIVATGAASTFQASAQVSVQFSASLTVQGGSQ